MPDVMEGKSVLITGARNKWSIAWHAALSLQREGARIAFSVFGEREEGAVRKLIADTPLESSPIFHCDATQIDQVTTMMDAVGKVFDGHLDGLLHGMAFAKTEELSGEYIATSQDGFALANNASVYTLLSLARAARPLMRENGGSIVTLTYLGAERVVPRYNVMGVAKAALEASVRYLAADLGPEQIRVNAVSAGPIKTLAAGAISGFDSMIQTVSDRSPMRRAVGADEVGDAVLFLMSKWSRGITGETLYVDAGYNIMGL